MRSKKKNEKETENANTLNVVFDNKYRVTRIRVCAAVMPKMKKKTKKLLLWSNGHQNENP